MYVGVVKCVWSPFRMRRRGSHCQRYRGFLVLYCIWQTATLHCPQYVLIKQAAGKPKGSRESCWWYKALNRLLSFSCLLHLLQQTFIPENAETQWRDGEAQERFDFTSRDEVRNFSSCKSMPLVIQECYASAGGALKIPSQKHAKKNRKRKQRDWEKGSFSTTYSYPN